MSAHRTSRSLSGRAEKQVAPGNQARGYLASSGADPEEYFSDTSFSRGILPVIAAVIVSCVLSLVAFNTVSPTLAVDPAHAPQAALALQPEQVPPSQIAAAPIQDQAHGGLARLFTPSVLYWEAQIINWANAYGIDPNLAATVMQIESCGHPSVSSSAGAMGLFQVMPFHFASGEDGFDPDTNARRGMAYLQRALEARSNDPRLGLAGYNAGITGANRPETDWPNQTQRYVYWGAQIYADAQSGLSHSERLAEWLGAGGASLCRKANEVLGLAP